tara:strand:+ start:4813 stop:6018 length:1206 start_codon:yes stop_codon:yes gene_type:complete
MKKIAIIGAGQAGAGAALKLRELGFEGEITLLGDEAYPPYERPELSKGYALGRVAFDNLVMLTPAAAEEKAIDLRLDCRVRRIDRAARVIETDAGDLSYDMLILATGGAAKRLPLPEPLRRKTHSIRTRDDVDALRNALPEARSVVVIGGGWLGTEAAITARALCPQVDLIEVAPRLCARVAPSWLSDRLSETQMRAGVTLHLGAVPVFAEDGTISVGGTRLAPDLMIEAIGMRAMDELAVSAGLACDDGVLVSPQGQTEDPAVFAIGDCARLATGEQARRESWQYANQSAEDVARLLTGQIARMQEPDWFWSTQADFKVQMLGSCPDEAVQLERVGPRGGVSRLFLKGARLVGCVAINNPREIAEARRVIASRQAIDSERARDGMVPLSRCIVDAREAVR